MKRWMAVLMLVWMMAWTGAGIWGACPAANPFSGASIQVQGPDPTGNAGYPLAVVGATGCPLDVNVLTGGGGAVTIADGADVTQGAIADAFVTFNSPGTVSSKLSGLLVLLGTRKDLTGSIGPNQIGTLNSLPAVYDPNAGVWQPVQGQIPADGASPLGVAPQVQCFPELFRGVNAGGVFGYDRQRTPFVFKTVATAAAGNTALWMPAAGGKFRLMRWRYTVTDNATFAAPGVLTISLFDGAAGAIGQADDVFVPAIALNNTGQLTTSPWIDLGNGQLSALANNVLNVNLSAALVTGTVRVQVCGTEE